MFLKTCQINNVTSLSICEWLIINTLWACELIIFVPFLLRTPKRVETFKIKKTSIQYLRIDCPLNNCAVYRCWFSLALLYLSFCIVYNTLFKGIQSNESLRLNELLICCSMNKNRRHIFLYVLSRTLRGWNPPLKKIDFFLD